MNCAGDEINSTLSHFYQINPKSALASVRHKGSDADFHRPILLLKKLRKQNCIDDMDHAIRGFNVSLDHGGVTDLNFVSIDL